MVAVARKGETPIAQQVKDFGISESCRRKGLKSADVQDGIRPGVSRADSEELKDLKQRNRALEQWGPACGGNEVLRRAAAAWRGNPVSERDLVDAYATNAA